MPKMQV